MHCQFVIPDDISFPIVVGTDGGYQREGVILLGLLDPATSDGHASSSFHGKVRSGW